MSRTSRRVSRPLIAALTVVIVLGVVFTVHKIRKAPAAEAKKAQGPAWVDPAPVMVMASASVPPARARVGVEVPGAKIHPGPVTTSVATPALVAIAPESTALVTQTPTEKAPADPVNVAPAPVVVPSANIATSAPLPSANGTPSSDAAPRPAPVAESSEADSAGLAQWAKGNAKLAAHTVIASAAPAPSALPVVTHDAAPAVRSEISAQPVEDAKAKVEAGDLVTARQILNDALVAGRGDGESLKKQIEQINETLVFSARRVPEDPWGGNYQVASGERLGSIAGRSSVSWELLARINNVTPKKLRAGQWIKIAKGPFHAVVIKHLFRMELYLGAAGGPGSMYVRSFQVGLGKDNSTPTGLWMCKAGDKIRNPRYYPPRGGDIIAPDDPKNPLAGYWIAIEGTEGQALGKESYGIHGTIDPTSIGKMESMGCIRLRSEDISWVFDLLVDGKSKVLVKD